VCLSASYKDDAEEDLLWWHEEFLVPLREDDAEEEREEEEEFALDFASVSRPKVAISSTKEGRVVIVGQGDERRTREGILKARGRQETI
jgi:hypothetical protein